MNEFKGKYDIYNKEYLITINENMDKLKNLIINNNGKLSIINEWNRMEQIKEWYIFKVINEYKLYDAETKITKDPKFPCILKEKINTGYYFEHLILNKESYNQWLKLDKLDAYDIKEIECYPIIIDIIKKDNNTLINQVKDYINKKIEEYDDVKNRIAFNRYGDDSLEIYL
jgi:hypothetical protein